MQHAGPPRPTPPSTLDAAAIPHGARRTATVLFADLCGYTGMTEVLDPEEVTVVMNRIVEAATQIVEAHGGTVNQVKGDEVTALFGIPTAHDDDPRRAVSAALAMHGFVRILSAELESRLHQPLRLHTAINSGLVVVQVRDQREGLFGLTGDAVNVAARLVAAAEPDAVVVGAETHRAVAPFFVTEALGPLSLRGKQAPVVAHRVLRPSARTRFEAAVARGLTRFTGRARELALLARHVRDVAARRGGFVAVSGQAGVGKSRLLHELRSHPDAAGVAFLEGRCQSFGATPPYGPFLAILRALLGLRDEDQAPGALAGQTPSLDPAAPELATWAHVYRHLLSMPAEAGAGAILPPEGMRAAVMDALAAAVRARAARGPFVVIIEDLHWADEASMAAMRHLARTVADAAVLVIVSHRTYWQPDFGASPPVTIALEPLGSADTAAVVGALFEGRLLPEGLTTLIGERTGGNPFFIEEVCQSLVEADLVVERDGRLALRRTLPELVVPESVQAVVRARIDRLDADDGAVVRHASVLGATFTRACLAAIVPDPALLGAALERLRHLELVQPQPGTEGADETWGFKHAITCDVAYGTLLHRQRRQLHAAAGAALETLYAGRLAEHYESLADHFAKGGEGEKAAHYAERAGDKAAATFSLTEARRQYGQAIQLLDDLPEEPERARRRVDVSIKWGAVSVYAPSPSHIEVLQGSYERATALGYAPGAVRSIYWMGWIEHALGNHAAALAHFERGIVLAEELRDRNLVAQLYCNIGQSCYHTTDFDRAVQYLEHAILLRRASSTSGRTVVIANSLGYLGLIDAEHGQFALAHERVAEALQIVRDAGQRQLEASLLTMVAWVQLFQGDWPACVETARTMRAVAERVGAPFVVAMSWTVEGYARAHEGAAEAGLGLLRDAVSSLEALGAMQSMSINYACLAETLARAGVAEEARLVAAKALERAAAGDRIGEPLAHRALGLAALATSTRDADVEAQARFVESIRIAERKGAFREAAVGRLCEAERAGRAGDVAHAAQVRADLAETFEAMGMAWHARRARNGAVGPG